jgi:hypothetical protein
VLGLEDGSTQRVLFTHPKWVSNGTIKGYFPQLSLPRNTIFTCQVGFGVGATSSDGVRFQVWEHHDYGGEPVHSRVADFPKRPDGRLATITADLSHLASEDVSLELRVDTGDGIGRIAGVSASPGQDWAMWVNPILLSRPETDGHTWLATCSRLTVNVRDEVSGDDPYLGMVYFRSTFARRGSTNVVILDELNQVGEDLDSGTTWPLRGLTASDAFSQFVPRIEDLENPLEARVGGLTIFGVAVLAMEEDADNRDRVRAGLTEAGCSVRRLLRERIEQAPLNVRLSDAIRTVDGVLGQPPPPCELEEGVWLGGGGGSFGELFSEIGDFLESADDLVGGKTALFAAVDPALYNNAVSRLALGHLIPLRPVGVTAGTPFQPVTEQLVVSGSGSTWTIDLVVNQAVNTYPRSEGF